MVDALVTYLLHTLFIGASIAAFSAPFLFVFWWRHRNLMRGKRTHFNYFMERFFMARESNYLIAVWAAAEAVVWFVIPEFLLVLLIFMKIQRKRELVIYDLIGTVVGTILAIGLHFSPATLVKLPYVTHSMIDKVHDWYSAWGVLGVFFQPFSGVPYKVFNALALEYMFFIPAFIALAVAARMVRYLIIYGIGITFYPLVHRFVRQHYLILLGVSTALFSLLLLEVVSKYQ